MRRLATGMLITMLGKFWFSPTFTLSPFPRLAICVPSLRRRRSSAQWPTGRSDCLVSPPLGLPIPTLRLFRNKDRIGEALGRFVELNFASPEVVSSKLAGADMSGKLARWLSDPQRTDAVAAHVTRLIPQLLDSVDERHARRLVSGGLAHGAQRIDLGPLLAEVVAMLTRKSGTKYLLDKLLHEADEYIATNEPRIRARVRESTRMAFAAARDG